MAIFCFPEWNLALGYVCSQIRDFLKFSQPPKIQLVRKLVHLVSSVNDLVPFYFWWKKQCYKVTSSKIFCDWLKIQFSCMSHVMQSFLRNILSILECDGLRQIKIWHRSGYWQVFHWDNLLCFNELLKNSQRSLSLIAI